MVTDVENSRLSRPAPISRSGQITSVFTNALADAASRFGGNLFFMGFVVSLCMLALLYAFFARGLTPMELEKTLLVSSLRRTSA